MRWLIFCGIALMAFLAWVSGYLEHEDWTEAHDLYWGDGVYLNPIEHERRMADERR